MKKILTFLLAVFTLTGCSGFDFGDDEPYDPNKVNSSSEVTSNTTSQVDEEPSSSEDPNKIYTVTFLNYDGSFLYKYYGYKGDTAIYNGLSPMKPSTEKYDYVFSGWDKDLSYIKSDITTFAQYKQNLRTFEVTFLNYDGSALYTAEVLYGNAAVYPYVDPYKPSTSECAYNFIGWDKDLSYVTRDFSTTALYEETLNYYTVYFLNYDGTLLEETNVPYGSEAIYTGPTPTREDTLEYRYVFDGWDHDLSYVTYSFSTRATYYTVPLEFTVRFFDWDGTLLCTDTVIYGQSATYVGATPSKETNEEGVYYTFIGWDRDISYVTESFDTYAQYERTEITYTVTFLNWDGSFLYQTTVAHGGTAFYYGSTPTKPDTDTTKYTFYGWDRPLDNVTESFTTYALFQTETVLYKIEYYMIDSYYNQTLLYTDYVSYGEASTYAGITPTKQSTEQYHYYFTGWECTEGNLNYVTCDIKAYAIFEEELVKYTVYFSHLGEIIYQVDVPYGGVATYEGTTPSVPSDHMYDYIFDGWDCWEGDMNYVTHSFTVYSRFVNNYRYFNITFLDWDHSVLYETSVQYGQQIIYEGPAPSREASNEDPFVYSDYRWRDENGNEVNLEWEWAYEDRTLYIEYLKSPKERFGDFTLVECAGKIFTYEYLGTSTDIVIPNGVDGVNTSTLPRDIESLYVPESVQFIFQDYNSVWEYYYDNLYGTYDPRDEKWARNPFWFYDYNCLKTIDVSENNPYYDSKDGVLYDEGYWTLISYPVQKTDTSYNATANLEAIAENAFLGNRFLESIDLIDSVKVLYTQSFNGVDNLKEVKNCNALEVVYPYVFSGCGLLKDIQFGDNLRILDRYAIYGCPIQEIYLGKNLESFQVYPDIASARNPFTEMFRLEEITLSEENNNFYFDGVSLYSTNNNVLYAVFPNGETHYEVPENIEVISEYAFRFYSFKGAEQHISLDLPSNLQYLNSWCFGDIVLSEIELPESLRHIGSGAFYTSTFESLYIPKNVNSLGSDIVLSNEKLKEFVVHPENEYYTSVDGVIYSKDLGMLIEAPSNLQTSEYVILEGTTYVSQRALSTLMNVKRIVIPTSITILQWCSIGGYVLEEIEYLGTIEQWSNIEKGSNGYDYWYERYNVDNVIGVTCSDGLVELRFEY